MNMLGYLAAALVFMIGIYIVYRHTFLKKPKAKPPIKPHFTLKIEGDQP